MDKAIFPLGVSESEVMCFFVNGLNTSGMLLTTFGDQLNTGAHQVRLPELGE